MPRIQDAKDLRLIAKHLADIHPAATTGLVTSPATGIGDANERVVPVKCSNRAFGFIHSTHRPQHTNDKSPAVIGGRIEHRPQLLGNGFTRTLLCFMQVFVVSNRDSTYYFANNNARHFSFNADERFLPIYQFAKPDNTKVSGLDEFADEFLPKCTLGQMISRYMVLVASEQKLLMMRPYQIYAVKNIVKCIEENSGNGYIWHTTGSGKTLTSFKASTLLKAT